MSCECEKRKTHRSPKEQRLLVNRLSRIEGQIRGIKRMIEEDDYCTDVLNQVSAAQSALSSFSRILLSNHIKNCVTNGIKAGDGEVTEDLLNTLAKFMK